MMMMVHVDLLSAANKNKSVCLISLARRRHWVIAEHQLELYICFGARNYVAKCKSIHSAFGSIWFIVLVFIVAILTYICLKLYKRLLYNVMGVWFYAYAVMCVPHSIFTSHSLQNALYTYRFVKCITHIYIVWCVHTLYICLFPKCSRLHMASI